MGIGGSRVNPSLIFDSTPLIYLGKANLMKHLEGFENELLIPSSIFDEVVVKGKIRGIPDARRIDDTVSKNIIKIIEVDEGEVHSRLAENRALSRADLDVIQLARERNGIAIMDESYGRSVCDVEGIHHRGSLWLISRMIHSKLITKEEARESLDLMIEEGWFCSTKLYSKAIRMFDKY